MAAIPQHLSPHDRACEALGSASRSLAYAADQFAAMGLPDAESDARDLWMELLRLNSDVTKSRYRKGLRTRGATLRVVP